MAFRGCLSSPVFANPDSDCESYRRLLSTLKWMVERAYNGQANGIAKGMRVRAFFALALHRNLLLALWNSTFGLATNKGKDETHVFEIAIGPCGLSAYRFLRLWGGVRVHQPQA